VTNKKSAIPNFEGALKDLEQLVTQMEGGTLSLEDALLRFEEGIALARQCQQALTKAEQRIQHLMVEEDDKGS